MAPSTSPCSSHQSCGYASESLTPKPAEWKPSLHELFLMVSLSITSLMISLDATVIVTSLSSIVASLGGTTTEGFWVGTSYLLACAVFMPFIASLSDIFGRPVCLYASLILFTLGSILCCIARNFTVLLTGRCIQGTGGGGITILGLVIFTDIVPLRFRPKYYGLIQGAWALGTCIGPVAGGAFAEYTSWRWVFYLMFPLCFIGFASLPWVLTLKPRTATLGEKLARVDWIGGLLLISSSASFLIAISWGGTQHPWGNFRTVVPLVLGVFGIGMTLLWERLYAREPFLRKSLFYCRSTFAVYFGSAVQGFLLYGQLYYIPFYFLSVKSASPVRTGVNILPVMLILVPTSVVIGIIISRINRFRWAIWSGWAITTLSTGLAVLFNEDTPAPVWATILIIIGLGQGLLLNSQNFATQAIALPNDAASAAGMYIFLRSLGMAIGVGVGGSTFQNVMKLKLLSFHLPAAIAANSEAYISTLNALPDDSLLKIHVRASYVHGLRGTYASFCGIAAVAGIISLMVKKFGMDKELVTEHKLGENRWRKLSRMAVTDVDKTDAESAVASTVEAEKRDSRPISQQGGENCEIGTREELVAWENRWMNGDDRLI